MNEVQYEGEKLKNLIDRSKRLMGLYDEKIKILLLTKYKDWSYEREWRMLGTLKNRDPVTGYYYIDFGKSLSLREVIVGARCPLNVDDVGDLVGKVDRTVTIKKARAAFTKFEIIQQRQVALVSVKPTQAL